MCLGSGLAGCAHAPERQIFGLGEGLQHASVDDLKAIEVEGFSLGIHFPRLDADLYVPALLEGVRGSKRRMATQLGGRPAVASAAPPRRPRRARTANVAGGPAGAPVAGSGSACQSASNELGRELKT